MLLKIIDSNYLFAVSVMFCEISRVLKEIIIISIKEQMQLHV